MRDGRGREPAGPGGCRSPSWGTLPPHYGKHPCGLGWSDRPLGRRSGSEELNGSAHKEGVQSCHGR